MRFIQTLVASVCLMVSISTKALEVGAMAPDFVANHIMLDNSEVSKSIRQTERTGQYLILDFFGTTCQYCIASMPLFAQMASDLRDVVTSRYFFSDADQAAIRNFIGRNRSAITVEVSTDPTRQIPRAYGLRFLPTLFLIDPAGQIVYKHIGQLRTENVAEITRIVRSAP